MQVRCCETCLSWLGRNDDGEPVCGAPTPTLAIVGTHRAALAGANARNRCPDYRENPNTDDTENES